MKPDLCVCVLPNRQPRIGQEESNLPAEQAVNNQNHQVYRLGGFLFYSLCCDGGLVVAI